MADAIAVYRYIYWDEEAKMHKTSTQYATPEMIRSGLGRPIADSMIKVRRAALSERGLYFPLNSSQENG